MTLDALTALANGLNMRAKLAYAGGVCGQWTMDHNSDRSIWFHLVGKGNGWVHSPALDGPLELVEGDVMVFLPHAAQHYLSYSPDHVPLGDTTGNLSTWAAGETGFICGEIELTAPQSPLWHALPAEIVIRKKDAGDSLSSLIELVIAESEHARFGGEAVIERLCDGFFILLVRHCIEADLVRDGVFAAMKDRRIATVLELIHREPWHRWSIAELCGRAGISKTVLAERFASRIGMSPIEYLTDWRMQIAARWLKETAVTLDQVAERCGYDTASSFSKAFKRAFGVSPATYRRRSDPIAPAAAP